MKRSRNTAFLIELLVNVLVLSISCAVLVQVLVHAALMVRDTNRRNAAGNEIYAMFETLRAEGSGAIAAGDAREATRLAYDKNWQQVDEAEALYFIDMQMPGSQTRAGTLVDITAVAYLASGEEICRFTTAVYQPDWEVQDASQ